MGILENCFSLELITQSQGPIRLQFVVYTVKGGRWIGGGRLVHHVVQGLLFVASQAKIKSDPDHFPKGIAKGIGPGPVAQVAALVTLEHG